MPEILQSATRLGIHYFPDTLHYREQDLMTWMPEFKELGIGWLTLFASINRAIPESFINGLISANIQPILHFPLLLDTDTRNIPLSLLFENYARWGVKYIVLFDQPNIRRSWPGIAWTQADLIERFLDIYLPLADTALQSGLTPVFPPLEPGGDYWDTAFLQSALRSIQRRGYARLLQNMALGAYAWTYDRPLDWGAGGPEAWPGTHPYYTPSDSQDQIGFRIFDWYQAAMIAELGKPLPVILLRGGSRPGDNLDQNQVADLRKHAERNLAIAQLLSEQPLENPPSSPNSTDNPLPGLTNQPNRINLSGADKQSANASINSIVCLNFWLLSAEASDPDVKSAWYKPDGSTLPVVNTIKQWAMSQHSIKSDKSKKPVSNGLFQGLPAVDYGHPIDHYLLLPIYAWGVADWDIEAIKPYLQKYHPTVGFSAYEARLANKVTIFGESQQITDDTLAELHAAGCQVERMNKDGAVIEL